MISQQSVESAESAEVQRKRKREKLVKGIEYALLAGLVVGGVALMVNGLPGGALVAAGAVFGKEALKG